MNGLKKKSAAGTMCPHLWERFTDVNRTNQAPEAVFTLHTLAFAGCVFQSRHEPSCGRSP